jgi:DNA-binding Lrp family transcriptional regulator
MPNTGSVSVRMDELDLSLLDAVHVNPRASFEELARILDISAATALRRWRQLESDGQAWVSSAPGAHLPLVWAMVEADCAPGHTMPVAHRFAEFSQVFSVHVTTGDYGVYALVVAADADMMARLILDVLPAVDGLTRMRSAVVVQLLSGTQWRLGAISAAQAKAVGAEYISPGPSSIFGPADRDLYLALQHDGRQSYRDLALLLGRSESTVKRRVATLSRAGLLSFRADFARPEAGWPTAAVLLLQVQPADRVTDIGRVLVQWPETRVCATIIGGTANMFISIQLHHLSAIDAFLSRLLTSFPGITMVERRMTLRPVKSFGRLLDADGRASVVVPVDPWAASC